MTEAEDDQHVDGQHHRRESGDGDQPDQDAVGSGEEPPERGCRHTERHQHRAGGGDGPRVDRPPDQHGETYGDQAELDGGHRTSGDPLQALPVQSRGGPVSPFGTDQPDGHRHQPPRHGGRVIHPTRAEPRHQPEGQTRGVGQRHRHRSGP